MTAILIPTNFEVGTIVRGVLKRLLGTEKLSRKPSMAEHGIRISSLLHPVTGFELHFSHYHLICWSPCSTDLIFFPLWVPEEGLSPCTNDNLGFMLCFWPSRVYMVGLATSIPSALHDPLL